MPVAPAIRATPQRQRRYLVAALTLHSGFTDAIGFVALGGAFTSVMTGNMVLFGVAIADLHTSLLLHTAGAIACYVLGCVVGARIAGAAEADQPVWPRRVTYALAVELAIFAAFAVGWWGADSSPQGSLQLWLLGMNAVGLGIQSSAVQRFGVTGLSTTYMTGTLTTVVAHLTRGRGVRAVGDSLLLLVALICGAAAGTVAVRHVPGALPLFQLVVLAVVLASAAGLRFGRAE